LVSRFLITTALEQTWPKNPETPVLFLGEWCRIYSHKEHWSIMNAEILPYHWDDRHKLYNDYQYLSNLYEIVLQALQKQLNEIHGVDYSLRYWRILIGPWLGLFIPIVFDRWTMLKQAFEKYEISGCRVLELDECSLIPNEMNDCLNLFIDDDWNEMIYSQLLQEYLKHDILIESVSKENIQLNQSNNSKSFKSYIGRLRRLGINSLMKIKSYYFNENEYFFLNTYLPPSIEDELLLRLGQKPKKWKLAPIPRVQMDYKMREWVLITDSLANDFSNILNQMVAKHIPIAYLEGYQSLLARSDSLGWPQRPKCIFTSVSSSANDIFKIWAAGKTEHGVPLIIGQHGGHYGMTPWSFHEEQQISVSDAWLSWGWSDEKKPQIIPACNLKVIDHTVDYDPNGVALMVEVALPRYSYHMSAVPVAGQWLSYFEDQCRFISVLPEHLREKMLIRLYRNNNGWRQKDRWMQHFPNLKLEIGQEPMHNLVSKSRIYISTYNATTFLESLSWNMPTIIFWDPNHWELKDDALPYFELLKSVNIFHETPESAANHMTEIWNDIPAWWQSKSLQKNRKQFCDQYSLILEKPLDRLETIFQKFSTKAKAV